MRKNRAKFYCWGGRIPCFRPETAPRRRKNHAICCCGGNPLSFFLDIGKRLWYGFCIVINPNNDFEAAAYKDLYHTQRRLLKRMQWRGWRVNPQTQRVEGNCCPCCLVPQDDGYHSDDCDISALLAIDLDTAYESVVVRRGARKDRTSAK